MSILSWYRTPQTKKGTLGRIAIASCLLIALGNGLTPRTQDSLSTSTTSTSKAVVLQCEPVHETFTPITRTQFCESEEKAIAAYKQSFREDGGTDQDILESFHDACRTDASIDTPDRKVNLHNAIAREYFCP